MYRHTRIVSRSCANQLAQRILLFVAQYLEKRFNSVVLRKFASALSIIQTVSRKSPLQKPKNNFIDFCLCIFFYTVLLPGCGFVRPISCLRIGWVCLHYCNIIKPGTFPVIIRLLNDRFHFSSDWTARLALDYRQRIRVRFLYDHRKCSQFLNVQPIVNNRAIFSFCLKTEQQVREWI